MNGAALLRQQALARSKVGDDAGAIRLFAQALSEYPGDARLANSAGNFHASAGRDAQALNLFDRALSIMPELHEAAINRAVVLTRLGRANKAAAALRDREASASSAPRYWTARGAAELAAEDFAAAAASYDHALRREPGNARALQGRGRASLEQGEARAVGDYERALAAAPGNPYLLLGYAQALHVKGNTTAALRITETLVAQLPGWVEGLELHARLRWARRDDGYFVDHYDRAAIVVRDPALYRSWAAMLTGVDRHTEAADILARARALWPDNAELQLAEAIAAGEAGDFARAATLFTHDGDDSTDWRVAHARHLLRLRDPAAAERLLQDVTAKRPGDIAAWSLIDLCWRLIGDSRHHWLHGQDGLIREVLLPIDGAERAAACELLMEWHQHVGRPIGQSVKHGSQTRGALFARAEPIIQTLRAASEAALLCYRAGLPPADVSHPLLRHRDEPWAFAGSWSILLDGAGYHAAHVHPRGVISSAAYLIVPSQVDDLGGPGWLEIGKPPPTQHLDLPALMEVKPREGWCAIFPSTLFHGTRPIAAGQRLTFAFDIAPKP